METIKLWKTLYVFDGKKLCAILKEQSDKTFKVVNCYIGCNELKAFLHSEDFSVL